jgi:3-methylcrotonyl-CoA carboxylase alpha subunit
MGDKARAKALMAKAGVPIVPGYHGEKQDAAIARREARRIGFPVLDQGQRRRRRQGNADRAREREFERALEGATARGALELRRRSRAAGKVSRAAAAYRGAGVRRCSAATFCTSSSAIARCSAGHQKVLEEAPAPGESTTSAARRSALPRSPRRKRSATSARERSNSSLSADGEFFFMEMNTRLQVEHRSPR